MSEKRKLPFYEANFDPRLLREGDEKRRNLSKEVMKSRGVNIKDENVTEGDLFSVPSVFSPEELVELIKEKFDVSEIDKNFIREVSEYFNKAKEFVKEYLLADFPDEIENIKEIKSETHLLKLLGKTRLGGSRKNFMYSHFYCGLAFIVLAENEFKKKEMGEFRGEGQYLYDNLFEPDSDGVKHFHMVRGGNEDFDKVGIFIDGEYNGWINTNAGFRGKDENSIIAKLIRDPKVNAGELVRDGIGLKFEVSTDSEAIELVKFLSKHFKSNFKAKSLKISDVGFLEPDERKILASELENLGVTMDVNEDNPASNKHFKTIKLEGKVEVNKEGKPKAMKVSRNFEVQIFSTSSDNVEKGFAHHFVYRGVQKLFAYSRLFGTFSDEYLDILCEETSENSGIGKEKIKNYILSNFLSVIEHRDKKGNKIKRYGFTKHLKRWRKAGLLPKSFEFKPINNKDSNGE